MSLELMVRRVYTFFSDFRRRARLRRALQIEKHQTPRPMRHDLPRNIIQDLHASVEKLTTSGGPVAIDARPATQSRWRCGRAPPFSWNASHRLDNAKTVAFNEKQDSDRLQQWLESFDPDEFGKYGGNGGELGPLRLGPTTCV